MIPRDRPAPAAEEIEITPEMIEAGVAALDEFLGSYDRASLAKVIYTTMRLNAPCQTLLKPEGAN